MDFKKEVVPEVMPVFNLKIMYTDPKIFIPNIRNEAGKMVPTIAPGKYWYVKYSFRDPTSGKLKEFREKKGINTINSVALRTRAIKNLYKAVLKYLQLGYSPSKITNTELQSSAKVAIEMAIKQKTKIWSSTTKNICVTSINIFIRFLKKNDLCDGDIGKLQKSMLLFF